MKRNDIPDEWLQLTTSKSFDQGFNNEDPEIIKEIAVSTANHGILIASLVEQLCRLFNRDVQEQQKIYFAICHKLKELRLIDDSYQVKEFASLRGHYRQAVIKCLSSSTAICDPLIETSRYLSEFEELEWISSGGFGQVFRARHRLDQVEYAVKKIKIRYRNTAALLRTLEEVKTLARLNHRNIVQYKAAWLEVAQYSARPAKSEDYITDSSDIVEFERSGLGNGDETFEEESCLAVCAYQPLPSRMLDMGATLFVTMQLCDKTMRQWLDERNKNGESVNHELVLNIMQQATAGLEYIHANNIVHHDIKPSNIFMSKGLTVQVGDFGLACNSHDIGACPLSRGQRGTSLYAAPEQLRGQCHQRSDIFSLGLVLIELLTPFSTDMERVAVLNGARSGRLPSGLMPPIKALLTDLTAKRLNERPTASALWAQLQRFDGSAVDDKDSIIAELRKQLAQKDAEVRRLKRKKKINVTSDSYL